VARRFEFPTLFWQWGGVGEDMAFSSLEVKGVVEKPLPQTMPSDLAVLGRSVRPSWVLELLEHSVPIVGREIQLTDALEELLGSQGLYPVETDAQGFDCANKLGFLSASLADGMRDLEAMRAIETLFCKSDV